MWSSSSAASPARPTCWRSTPRSRRRAPAMPARASPWSPRGEGAGQPDRQGDRGNRRADQRDPGSDADSAQSIQGITGTISQVSETATAIASAVEQQGAATQEITRNVAGGAGHAGGLGQYHRRHQAAQQTGAAASQVLASAGELSQNGEALKAQAVAFLREVRRLRVRWPPGRGAPTFIRHGPRRRTIHALRCRSRQRRGWRAFAHHDGGPMAAPAPAHCTFPPTGQGHPTRNHPRLQPRKLLFQRLLRRHPTAAQRLV